MYIPDVEVTPKFSKVQPDYVEVNLLAQLSTEYRVGTSSHSDRALHKKCFAHKKVSFAPLIVSLLHP